MEEVTNKCRLCLKLIKSGGVNVFEKTNEEDHEIGSFIFEAFQLQLDDMEGLPKKACKKCDNFIEAMRLFKEEVFLAQLTLSQLISSYEVVDITEEKLPEDEKELETQETQIEIQDTVIDVSLEEELNDEETTETVEILLQSSLEESPEISDEFSKKLAEIKAKEQLRERPSTRTRQSRADVNSSKKRNPSTPYTVEEEKRLEENMRDLGIIKCHECQESCDSLKQLCKHYRKEHKSWAYIFCCNAKRRTGIAAFEHMEYHLNKESYQCDICKLACLTRANLRTHMKAKHPSSEEDLKFQCDQCEKKFFCEIKLKDHKKLHDKPMKCKYCGKGFNGNAHMVRHIERIHEVKDRVVCDVCGKWFSNKQTLGYHLARHKSQENKKECPHCGKMIADLKQHIKVVHLGSRRGGVVRIPGLDSKGRPQDSSSNMDISEGSLDVESF